MRFLMLYTPDKSKDRSQHVSRTLAKMSEMRASNILLSAAGIGYRDRNAARIVLTDGAERRECPPESGSALFDADGLATIEAADLSEAMDVASDFIGAAGDGRVEVVQLIDSPSEG